MQTTPIRFDSFNRLISFEALMFFSRAVSKFSALFLLLAATCNCAVQGNEPTVPTASVDQKEKFHKGISDILEKPHTGISIPGLNGWIFFDKELRHLAAPRFWSDPSSAPPETTDPLAAILDFKSQLDEAGIDLLVVPVPPKAAIYPDQLLLRFSSPTINSSRPGGTGCRFCESARIPRSEGSGPHRGFPESASRGAGYPLPHRYALVPRGHPARLTKNRLQSILIPLA